MEEQERLTPISALQHFSYCPRQCALIHVEQCFEDNSLTMAGNVVHARVEEADSSTLAFLRIERGLPLFSQKWLLIGKADVVEFWEDGTVYPVEYKHGARSEQLHDNVQLAAQAMCLEEMLGVEVNRGAIYHFGSRRRREVQIDAELVKLTQAIILEVRATLSSLGLPPPVNDSRCNNCSLIDICQPKLILQSELRNMVYGTIFDPLCAE